MKKFFGIIGLALAVIAFGACGSGDGGGEGSANVVYDREGNQVVLPDEINTIITLMPSKTEIVMGLGFGDYIIATDQSSGMIDGIPSGIATLDYGGVDVEHIISLNPDVIIASDMLRFGGNDPLEPARNLGIAVAYIPTSNSIEGIKDDIRFVAQVLGVQERGEELVAQMEAELDTVAQIVAGINNRRMVYFEIWPLFSFGTGTFLHELLEIAGGISITRDMEGWVPLSDEFVLDINPDVILTSTDPGALGNPVEEILNRTGWGSVTAVAEGNVHFIDTDASNRPTHNVVYALWEIARAIYPEYFAQ